MHSKIIAVILFSLTATIAVYASPDLSKKTDRVRWAKELSIRFDRMAAIIPNPDPAQEAFISKELADIKKLGGSDGIQRSTSLLTYPPYAQKHSKELLLFCVQFLQSAQDETKSEKEEILAWAVTATTLLRVSFNLEIVASEMVNSGTLKREEAVQKLAVGFGSNGVGTCLLPLKDVQIIYDEIVIPCLERSLSSK